LVLSIHITENAVTMIMKTVLLCFISQQLSCALVAAKPQFSWTAVGLL